MKTERKVGLKNVAEKLDVSVALVSYVLNGKEKEARVSPIMAKRIKKMAQDLNYQPNLIAKSLKIGKTKTIGLIVADISNPFFSSLARIIENEAAKHGYTVIFGSSDEQFEKSQSLIDAFISRQVDGLIIAPVEGTQNQIMALKEHGVPVVLIDRGLSELETHTVTINNYESVFNAVDLLVKNGYQKIGMLAYESSLRHMQERIKGYKDALMNNHLEFWQEMLVKLPYHHELGLIEEIIMRLITDSKMDALVLATNSISLNTMRVIAKLKLRIPEDIAVVCFDQNDAYEFFYTPMTYIKQDLKTIGESAVSIMMQQLAKPLSQKLSNIVVPSQTIIGKSAIPKLKVNN